MEKRIPLDNVCVKKTLTLSSQYDGLIDYVDISSVDNTEKRIVSMQCVSAKEAPSRAKQLLEVGDILVSTVRPNLNAVAMVDQQTDNLLVGSTGYCVLRCNDSIDKRYVFHFCQSPYFVDDMTSKATGASYPAVSSGIVKSSTIPDYPIEKQKQIADRLDKVSELISLRKEQLAKLDQLVKSRFIELFEGRNYPVFRLGDVCCKITDGTHKTPTYLDSGVTFISAKNIVNGELDFSDVKYISDQEYTEIQRRCQTEEGDILLSKSGSLGSPAIIKTTERIGLFESLAVIKYDRNRILAAFLCEQLKSDKIQRQFKTGTKGVAIKHLHLGVIADTNIVVPPIEEQRAFAAFVEQTDKSKLAIQQSLDKLELLKKSLMQEYFG